MGYWKTKVLPQIKKVFGVDVAKKAAAVEACKSFDDSKEELSKEFEEKKAELQPKVLEIYEASSAEIKTLVKDPKEAGLKKHSGDVQSFLDKLNKIEFPGSKVALEACSKFGPALAPGPVIFVFEKVSTFVVTEENPREIEAPAAAVTEEATTTKETSEVEKEIATVSEEKPCEVAATVAADATTAELDQALKITFKAMCKMLLSLEDGSELSMLQKDVACVCHGMLAFPLNLPWTTFSKGLKARKRIMNLLEKMIQERRARHSTQIPYGHGNTDFLQYLLLGKNREPCSSDSESSLTDAQIKDNILTMIIAGQDTTASAMTWMVKYLDENQGVLKVVQDEVLSLQKRVATKSSLTLEDLNEMTYAAKVVKESLRMASIVPWFPRVALRDCNILGYTIKKGWNINVDARAIHFDPTLHKDPHKFIPSRFDNEPKPYTYLAFGAGGRTCLGMNLARTMMLVFIYRLITTYKWEVTDPDSSVENWALFSRLKSGCPIQITRINNETRIKDN